MISTVIDSDQDMKTQSSVEIDESGSEIVEIEYGRKKKKASKNAMLKKAIY
jgi:hypothetical protein